MIKLRSLDLSLAGILYSSTNPLVKQENSFPLSQKKSYDTMPWLTLGSGAMAAQRPLEPLILVRVQAPQLTFLVENTGILTDFPD